MSIPASVQGRHGATLGRSHTARVVNDLGLAIVSGRLEQGALLPLDSELTGRYGVSRTVIREALKTLGAKGLVRPRARVGTRVCARADWNLFDANVLKWHAELGLSADFLMHLGEMRLALEPAGAALAARRRSPAHLEEMRGWLTEMGAPDISRAEFAQADLGLHLAIARAAANPFLLSVSTLIEVALGAMLTIASPADNPTRLAESVEQHRRIVAAIEAGDGEAAQRAMAAVVQVGIDRAGPQRQAAPAPAR